MKAIGRLLIAVLLAAPSLQAAFGPLDVDVDRVVSFARAVEHHVVTRSNRLALYLEVPALQFPAVADVPVVRELARTLRLREFEQILAVRVPPRAPRSCQRPR